MKTSEQINELATSLAKAQGLFPEIPRNRSVKVKLKTGGEYNFRYATLDVILNAVRKPLAENGISPAFYLDADDKGDICITRLQHETGQWMECYFPIILDREANAQGWGSALTYAKRNGISAILAIHADEDDDGNGACGNSAEPIDERTQKPNGTGRAPRQQSKPPANGKTPTAPKEKIWVDMNESEKIAFCEKRIEESKGNYTALETIGKKWAEPKVMKGVSADNLKYLAGKLDEAMRQCEALQDAP
jgi:hypothetical protein